MRYQRTVNVNEILQTSSLAKLMDKGLFLHKLNVHLNPLLPAQFKALYRIANMEQDTLFVEVANGMVRQSILFQQQALLKIIQQDYPQVKKLQFRINPELSR